MKTKERILAFILTSFVIAILIITFVNKRLEKKNIKNIEEHKQISFVSTENVNVVNEIQKENTIKETTQDKNINSSEKDILTTYKGYPVIAKLEIPKINLETYVISEYSDKALGISVTKFYGGNPNEIGNFCIAGHNYITKNMFHDLKKLSVGDTFILTDNNSNEVIYEIYLVETVSPNETQCLSQETYGRIEVTLITCTTDSSKRIIVKAVKK